MFQKSLFLILINSFCFGFAIEDFIKRWRNEFGGPIKYIRAADVGTTNKYENIDIPTDDMVQCIENVRQDNDEEHFKTGITKFEDVFKFFGICVCYYVKKEKDLSKCSATIDYSQKELQYRYYQKFKLDQQKGTLKFFDQANLPEKTENVFFKTVTNRGSNNAIATISLSFQKAETTITSSSNEIGASIGGKTELKFSGFSVTAEIETKHSYTSSSEKGAGKTSTFTLEREFTIPPHSSRRIVCSVKKQDSDFVWELPVLVTGHVAIKLDRNSKNEDWIFVDVKYVAQYYKELTLTRDNPPKLRGFIRGRTRGSKHFNANAVDHPVDVKMTPVQEDLCNPLPSSVKK